MLTKRRESSKFGAYGYESQGVFWQEALDVRAKGPLDACDPDLLRLLREKYLSPPSTSAPNLMLGKDIQDENNYNVYRTSFQSWIRINGILKALFSDQPPGFFLEAGALDGEFISNTLHLEHEFGWTGLLIEADPVLYTALTDKHRRSWSSQSCISTSSFAEIRTFESYRPKDEIDLANELLIRSTGNLQGVKAPAAGQMGLKATYSVQCFPLLSYLLALDKTDLQYVSLDVEGAEADILLKLPWERVNVTVWTVEHRPQNTGFKDHYLEPGGAKYIQKAPASNVSRSSSPKSEKVVYVTQHDPAGGKDDYFVLFMREKGYRLYDYWDGDYTFIKTDSPLCQKHCNVLGDY
ncbi:uncharacterized protein LOC135213872 [Macrobrachium nipponense]|uniref:uncharacterized protein LOC135213872 n=1 Tax=Macrobrachium nipponense TaxID=159736 RepID=UPI0030C86447